ncbi:MAG: P-type conjugative transfer protein TrbG [Shewanella sp.]|uniref:P-type conjugative transfer protein TrbG n=1 Tax=Shewanella sp. SNU WT4 TaxID=2590015 RepID=UPI00112B4917|nr:P-type conjugative transfer protein TrbG [Shewanella sp. SNU WT4]QDF68660.1 P-type conjugative transfer protein TrbG [Shewanella sp. SNU WT4]
MKQTFTFSLLLLAMLPGLAQANALNAKEKQATELAQDWIAKDNKTITDGSGRVTYFYGASLPTVVCAPFKTCVLELDTQEVINPDNGLQIGDAVRWRVTPTVSGSGDTRRTQLIIKPTDTNLETNLTIATNKRIYQVKLISRANDWMPLVNFEYPEERAAQWAAYQSAMQVETQKNTLPDGQLVPELDFNYDVSGKADFKPLRVYNDGRKTIIEMPTRVEHRVLPTLLVVNGNQQELVNYRYKNSYIQDGRRINGRFVVDQLSDAIMLVVGVGGDQESILIEYEGQ